jgi:DNA-directed RNA polymerase specialized sigma subunit
VAQLSGLSERERRILEEEERHPTEIARRLGLSTERVRQIERRARAKVAAAAPDDARRST